MLALALSLSLTVSCGSEWNNMDTPPESEYTQAEAYAPMEQAVTDAVESLPDFPGFEQRSWAELPCSHNGVDDPDYTNIEIRYRFSDADSESQQVRTEYVDILREYWSSQGYSITTDEPDELAERTDYDLVAEREDGISLWYRVWGRAGLLVQSGCVPVSDVSEIEYIPPMGGIEPGGEHDLVDEYFPDGIPAEGESTDAIAPFEESSTSMVAFGSPADYGDQL